MLNDERVRVDSQVSESFLVIYPSIFTCFQPFDRPTLIEVERRGWGAKDSEERDPRLEDRKRDGEDWKDDEE